MNPVSVLLPKLFKLVKLPLKFELGTRDPEILILFSEATEATLTTADCISLETIVLAMNGLFYGN